MINDKIALKNLKKIQKNHIDSIYFTTHMKWQSIFKRQTKLNKKSLNYFLDQSKEVAWGIGVSQRIQNEEIENLKFLYDIQTMSSNKFKDYLSVVECENILGEAPISFDGFNLTRSNLMNAESTYYLNTLLPELKSLKNIKVLEIGSGYGEFCRQLIKYSELDIKEYHLVDLPKNLLFAEKYLTSVFKESVGFKTRISNFTKEGSKLLIKFFLPSDIETLKDYDLIINTYSLQEMNSDTSSAYFEFIATHLNQDGFFYSINSPLKWDISSYNSYNGLKNLENLKSIMHRQIPPSIEGTVPILNIFIKNSEVEYKFEDLSELTKLQSQGFSNLLNSVFKDFNLTKFSTTKVSLLLEKYEISDIETKNISEWNIEEVFCYFYFVIIESKSYDFEIAESVLKHFYYTKNKIVSLKLLFNFSKHINKKMSVDMVKSFFI